jgi:hypothetical protein
MQDNLLLFGSDTGYLYNGKHRATHQHWLVVAHCLDNLPRLPADDPLESLLAGGGDWMEVAFREKPMWPWYLDSNELGTRDFRATRRNILYASLRDSVGNGIAILSDGTHHTRSYLDGDRIGLMVAWNSGPGGFHFVRGMCEIIGAESMPFEKGTEIKDTVRMSLVGHPT